MIDKNTIYSYFQTDDFPTEEQFRATWDSFWHKNESIPMSQILGLNEIFSQTASVGQLNGKANTDGSNINVLAYQQKLQIDELISTAKQQVKSELLDGAPDSYNTLKEIADWISNDETAEAAILQAIQTESINRQNDDELKLNKPTTTSNTTSYPYVVGEDGNGNSARLPAGDLGKNIANSSLTSVANAAMNLGATYFWNTLGYPFYTTGLPDKTNDSTFSRFRVQDSNGQDAWSSGKNLMQNLPSQLSESEKTIWKTAMNGGWTTNTMSVAIITPPVVDNQNKNYWLTLKGVNLNLNPANFSIQIMDSTGTNVVATVPNSQVQLYSNGLDLTFYYNFKDLPIGTYRIRINNGVATLTTGASVTITVVALITAFDFGAITWNKLENTPNTNTINAIANSINYVASSANKVFANDTTVVAVIKSSQLINVDENFYIDFTFSTNSGAGTSRLDTRFGLADANAGILLSFFNLAFTRVYSTKAATDGAGSIYSQGSSKSGGYHSVTASRGIISRNNGLITVIFIHADNSVLIASFTGVNQALSFAAQVSNAGGTTNNPNFDLVINSLYKF